MINQTQEEWLADYDRRETEIKEESKLNMPSTIKYPETFLNSLALGFDGVSDWRWLLECFQPTRITPMDIDGIIERKGNFLVLESKKVGKGVDVGQMITLKSLYKLNCFTIMFIEGKQFPEKCMIWASPKFMKLKMDQHKDVGDIKKLQAFVRNWFDWANANKFKE